MEHWDAARFAEQDAQHQTKHGRDEYKDALRQLHYRNLTAPRLGSAERFRHFRFQAGEQVLADAGICHPVGTNGVVQQQARCACA